jgi:hypothetical protein
MGVILKIYIMKTSILCLIAVVSFSLQSCIDETLDDINDDSRQTPVEQKTDAVPIQNQQ